MHVASNAPSATFLTNPNPFKTPKASVVFEIMIRITANYNTQNKIKIEIPSEYTGIPICQCK